ncbi:hypothetical protein MNBD_NITROSPINAE01-1388 [hydrothermal vent metagenome]|uniref:Cytochrome c domain-containing protein n=1 Tax=hydrothermal vent metagenome TaxID=652676 RepID=A0A3B1CJL4_9ZZZZ
MKKINFVSIVLVAAFTALPLFSTSASAESAKDNYGLYCVQCHGLAGTGGGINAPHLGVAPRNHTSAKDMGELSDANVATAIRDGGLSVGKSSQMPSFKTVLTDAEIADIVKLLREKCKCEGKKK